MNQSWKTILTLVMIKVSICNNDRCIGLAISGGGDAGAWQAGVLSVLTQKYKQGYQVFSGVSIGAINAAYLSTFQPQHHYQATQTLLDYWKKLDYQSIYEPIGIAGMIRNLISAPSIYNNDREKQLLDQYFQNRTVKTPITITLTDYKKGKAKKFDLDKINDMNLLTDLIKGSTSVPMFFKPMVINGTMYVDGGVMENIDVESIITRCSEMGYSRKQVVIDIVFVGNESMNLIKNQNLSVFGNLKRYLQVLKSTFMNDAIVHFKMDNPDIYVRNFIKPINKLPSTFTLNFNNKQIRQMIEQGQKEAQIILNDTHQ